MEFQPRFEYSPLVEAFSKVVQVWETKTKSTGAICEEAQIVNEVQHQNQRF